jgi:hypothetical protein
MVRAWVWSHLKPRKRLSSGTDGAAAPATAVWRTNWDRRAAAKVDVACKVLLTECRQPVNGPGMGVWVVAAAAVVWSCGGGG